MDRRISCLHVGLTEPDTKATWLQRAKYSYNLLSLQQVKTGASKICGIIFKSTCWSYRGTGQQSRWTRISADDVGGDSQVKRHKIVQQAHVIYLVRPLFVLFRERIEDFPNCRAPEVFYQVYSPPYVTH